MGVTPKLHMAPANNRSAEGTASIRFSVICPPVGTAQTTGVSQAAAFTVWEMGRVVNSSSNSSAHSG